MSKGKISGASKRTLPEPKAAILNTPFDAHGGPDGRAGTLLDFSVNSNPFRDRLRRYVTRYKRSTSRATPTRLQTVPNMSL